MLVIQSLAYALRHKRKFDAILTIEDPSAKRKLRFHKTPHPDHLILRFEDIDEDVEEFAGPHLHHMMKALEFGRQHLGSRLLVHCHAGICRSTAIGLAILADRIGAGKEDKAVEVLLATNPDAVPTTCMVAMADTALERDGALQSAWDAMETDDRQNYRVSKKKILTVRPELFSLRPKSLYHPAMIMKPDTLSLRGGEVSSD